MRHTVASLTPTFFATACIGAIINWKLHESARSAEQSLTARVRHQANHEQFVEMARQLGLGDLQDLFERVMTEKGAWSDPQSLKGLQMVQDLVKANGFIKGFSSITADSNADQALLYRGKAAMMLHGSWSYGIQVSNGGKFVPDGGLGWMNFPPIEGGTGDPADTVGNPGQYLSISSKASAAEKDIMAIARVAS